MAVMWVAIPTSDEELNSNYKYKAAEIQKALEERKLTRIFAQWKGSKAIKCTQCGHREVLGPESLKENNEFWKKVKIKLRYRFRANDRLCAICTIKRLVKAQEILSNLKDPGYESTSDISVIPFKKFLGAYIEQEQIKVLTTAYNKLANKLELDNNVADIMKIDGTFFYYDELRPKELVKEYYPHLDKKKDVDLIKSKEKAIQKPASDFKQYLESAVNLLKKKNLEYKPTKYYGLLAMDGDNIGKWLSQSDTIEDQNEKSKTLNNIANTLPEIIRNDWKGYCIYSGGDDFLAFGPMEKSVSTASKLRDKLLRIVNNQITASAGLVINHYNNPLRKAIEAVRENVEMAKEIYGRNSLVITVQTSSGTSVTGGYKWEIRDENSEINKKLASTFSHFFEWLIKDKGLGKGFIYDLITEIPTFYDVTIKGKKFKDKMFQVEAIRLLKRHLSNKDSIEENELKDTISAWNIIASHETNTSDNETFDAEENLINLIKIISFFVREEVKEI